MNQSMLAVPQRAPPPLDLYGPIAADLEEVERILSQTLKSRYAQVRPSSITSATTAASGCGRCCCC